MLEGKTAVQVVNLCGWHIHFKQHKFNRLKDGESKKKYEDILVRKT